MVCFVSSPLSAAVETVQTAVRSSAVARVDARRLS